MRLLSTIIAIAGLTVALFAAVAAGAGGPRSHADDTVAFRSPSGNIRCVIGAGALDDGSRGTLAAHPKRHGVRLLSRTIPSKRIGKVRRGVAGHTVVGLDICHPRTCTGGAVARSHGPNLARWIPTRTTSGAPQQS